MTHVPRRLCPACGLWEQSWSLLCPNPTHRAAHKGCRATNSAGDVCAEPLDHCYPHRTADGRDFVAEQSDAEIGALVRAAYARHEANALVELESIESAEVVEVAGVCGPGQVLLRVRHRSALKGGPRG